MSDLTEQSRIPAKSVTREPNAERMSEYPNFAALSGAELEGEDFRIVSELAPGFRTSG
jgi:hypothetical protein